MNILFDNLETLIDAPNGIEKARELILQLAIQGKLTEQDPKDEPASELFKKIKKEKENLIAGGKIKKQKELPPIKDDGKPFELPKGWEWLRLEQLGETQTGTTPSKSNDKYFGDFIPFIGPGDIYDSKINYKKNGLSKEGLSEGRLIRKGSILMVCIGGSIGKSAINDIDVTCNQQINTITPFIRDSLKYLFYTLNASYFQNSVLKFASGTATPIINKQKWISIPVPLPPLNEQKRIVVKVNSLMALLDEIEEKRERRNQKRIKLNYASLEKLLTSKDDNELKTNWKQIEENFSTLNSVPENVEKLKQVILQLAIQGKLVKRDPNDEPASELLKKIKKEKEKLIAEGKIKKQKELPPINDEDKNIILPKSWTICQLNQLSIKISDGEHITPKRALNGHYLLSARNVTNEGIILNDVDYVEYEVFKKLRIRCNPNKNDILLSCSGSVGRVAIVDDDNKYVMVRSAAFIKPFQELLYSQYLVYALRSPFIQDQIIKRSRASAQSNLFLNQINQLSCPLPPYNEQKRIVEKVNELMSLCNALEEKLTNKEATAEKLVGAIVNTVTAEDKKKIKREQMIKDILVKHKKALTKLS